LAVFIRAQKRGVQAVAQIRDAVALPSEKRQLVFRREYQPHVAVDLVAIQIVAAAREQLHHRASVSVLRHAIAFDPLNRGRALRERVLT